MTLALYHRVGLSKGTTFNVKHVAQPVREPHVAISADASYTITDCFTVIEGYAPSLASILYLVRSSLAA